MTMLVVVEIYGKVIEVAVDECFDAEWLMVSSCARRVLKQRWDPCCRMCNMNVMVFQREKLVVELVWMVSSVKIGVTVDGLRSRARESDTSNL